MANFDLASLPPSMLHKILSKVATTSIRDFGCVRVAFPGFNAVGREYYFYKSVDLIFLNDWLDQVNAVRTFMLKCYQMGNPEAIYLRDDMMNLVFSVDHRGLVHKYHDFTREYVDRMYHMITSCALSSHWDYGKPEMFMSLLERIDPSVSYDCWCSAIIEPVFVVSIYGSRTRWKCDCCLWQCADWDFCNEIHLTARDCPIGD
ncbi:hypothetical protein DY000_02020878 [Brassica cretica]|uniref:F-box domain-containing protein n=1 Tax=Brassica cretica TaxID=69181 RepID=A0ABQ7DZQ7_BRACR|nr:hypothetical protein DY000_02020878 [Brassica cretica]